MNNKLSIINYQLSILLLMTLLFALPMKAQVNVGKDSISHSFSVLEVTAEKQKGGLRLPQLTTAQRDALALKSLSNPADSLAKGLTIFNTTTGCLEYWNGAVWVSNCLGVENPPLDLSTLALGDGTLTGRTCFDIAKTDDNPEAGRLPGRTWRADFTKASVNTQVYTFTASATGTVENVRYVVQDPEGALWGTQNTQSLLAGTLIDGPMANSASVQLTVNFMPTLNSTNTGSNPVIVGRTREQADSVTINIIYNNGTEDVKVPLTAKIQDGNCCGAMTAHGTWLNFMCHNLGANYSLDPFTYYSEGDTVTYDIKGGLYQWGRNSDGHQYRSSPTTPGPVPASVPGYFVTMPVGNQDWRYPQNNALWGDGTRDENTSKGPNDPCPDGWKIPSYRQWLSVFGGIITDGWRIDNPYITSTTNQCVWTNMGIEIGNSSTGFNLFLPSSGIRSQVDGEVQPLWSSSIFPDISYPMSFYQSSSNGDDNEASGYDDGSSVYVYFYDSNYVSTDIASRASGYSVRCVSE